MSTESTAIIIPTIEDTLKEVANAQDNAVALRNGFASHFEKLNELVTQAKTITVLQPKKAKELRLAIRAVRCAADATRKDLKEESLRYGKAVQGVYNVLEYQAVPIEEDLEKIEKAEELREQARKKALFETRGEELRPYLDPTHMSLGEMAEDAYQALLAGAKKAHEEKLAEAERQRVAEIERQQRETAERERLDKIRADEAAKLKAENERLAAEASKLRAEQEAKDRAADELRKKEREAAEIERKTLEAAQAAERKLAMEENQRQAAAALAEKHKREIAEAEAKRLKDEAAKKQRDEQLAVARAARAPEKEKIVHLAKVISAIPIPVLTSPEGQVLAEQIKTQVGKFAKWLENEGAKL